MKVVVLGAGYAGISLVRKLESRLSPDVSITLVERQGSHLVQHLVHRVIRAPELADRLMIPIDEILTEAAHRQATVTDVDHDAGRVELENGRLDYDVGAVCLGAQTAFYGLPGVAEYGQPLKTAADARRIRERFGTVQEQAGRTVVCGAGLSGVQLAGELAALAEQGRPEIVLLEQAGTVAPTFSEPFQSALAEELRAQDVQIKTGRGVERADEEAVELSDGTRVAYDQLVWAGGITGQDAMEGDRPQVRSDLRLGDRTLGLGDAVRVVDANGKRVPASAQAATGQAAVAARNISRLVEHERDNTGLEPRLDRYRYDPRGWLVSVGDETVAQVGPTVLRGVTAKTIKATVGAQYLTDIGTVEDAVTYVRKKFVDRPGA